MDRKKEIDPILVTVRLCNNRIKQRREEMGFTVASLAKASGVAVSEIYKLQSMRKSPLLKDGRWCASAMRLSVALELPLEDLFPASVIAVANPVVTRTLKEEDVEALLELERSRLELDSPDIVVEKKERLSLAKLAMESLWPRYRDVISLRADGETYDDIAKEMGVTRERVRQLEARGLYQLRCRLNRQGWRLRLRE